MRYPESRYDRRLAKRRAQRERWAARAEQKAARRAAQPPPQPLPEPDPAERRNTSLTPAQVEARMRALGITTDRRQRPR